MALIWSAYERVSRGEQVLLPVICYYGAGRAWLAHNERKKARARSNGPASRWEAFYDCLNERVRVADLAHWFQAEHIAMGNRQGRYRPGFDVVRARFWRVCQGQTVSGTTATVRRSRCRLCAWAT